MMKPRKHIAVILAAGTGERSGFSRPKQFVKLAGKPVIVHTIQAFHSHPQIDEIAVVTNSDGIHDLETIVTDHGFQKVKRILLGGKQRYESSLAAIRAYEAEAGRHDIKLIFHDAVRPLVTGKIINDVINALEYYNAVDVVIPASDTVVEANVETNTISNIPVRARMRLGQTPQAFAFSTIKEAYDRALLDPKMATTDDCGIVLRYLSSERIYLVEGATSNMKLTFGSDLVLLDKLMQCNEGKRQEAISETVLLSYLKGKTLVVFGGTSGIGESIARLAQAYDANVQVVGRSTGVDISNSENVKKAFSKIAASTGAVHAVVNTAAVLHRRPLTHMSEVEVEESVGTNIMGAVNVARFAYPYLAATKGHLMMFASSSYTYGRTFYSLYSASKAAIVNLTQALADEWSGAGIKVNCINPERTRTQMRVRAFGAEPEGSLLEPDVVARKALGVLASEANGFVYDITRG